MRRRLTSFAVVGALAAASGVALMPAGAGEFSDVGGTAITVRKTVQGAATGGFTVVVACSDGNIMAEATLNFGATGAPTTFSGDGPWIVDGGAWVVPSDNPTDPIVCTATETDADGAAATSWTCAYENVTDNGPANVGCDAANGTGTGPVNVALGSTGQGILGQSATVHFTNTIADAAPAAAEAVEAEPTFTG